jgi:transcriptional regulator with XRE-family HTH domain
MNIHPNRLREVRKKKGLSRKQLSERSKISERQIARLESETPPSTKVRERTINELAKACHVEPGVLTGEQPLPESEQPAARGERSPINAQVMPEVRLAYDLIKRRYGINQTTIINMAPLFFVLLAESSFAWRRRKLDEVREAANRLNDLGRGSGHLAFAFGVSQALDGADGEESSIENRDLFGTDVAQDTLDLGYDRFRHNPFADFLREIDQKFDRDTVWVDPEFLSEETDDFPDYEVCGAELEKITGGSVKAKIVLEWGYARISDIPDEFWAENATDARIKWLEEKFSEVNAMSDEELLGIFSDPKGDENAETGK